jgi:dihydrofolate reductase
MVACDSKRGIAKAGVQPWKLPTDEAYFQEETLSRGGVVLMGRKTFEVIGRPLAGRRNLVLTTQTTPIDGVELINDLAIFLRDYQGDVWIIGGATVFAQTLSKADELYITEIEADLGCDQFYPDYATGFALVSQSKPQRENGLQFTFCVYKRTTVS